MRWGVYEVRSLSGGERMSLWQGVYDYEAGNVWGGECMRCMRMR